MLTEIIKYVTSQESSIDGNIIKSFCINYKGDSLEYFIEIKNLNGDIIKHR